MNDNQNLTNENQPSDDEPTKDKIPLWLQGFDDEIQSETTDLSEEQKNMEDVWVKEIEQKGEEIVHTGDTQAKANKEMQLPDWIRENAEFEGEAPVSNDLSQEGEEKTGDENGSLSASSIEIERDEELLPNEPTDHGFIDISELDMEDSREPVQFIPIEEEDVNEELPTWLHDMINDQPVGPVIQTGRKDLEQQFTENQQDISELPQADLEPKEEETWQEISTAEDQVFHEPEQPFMGEEFSEYMDEEITKPVQIEPGSPDDWVQVEEAFVLPEDQHTFKREETMLDQGNFIAAIDMLTQELEGSPSVADLKKIQTLIDNYIEKSGKEKSALLELKGDIALKMNDPSGALQAYAQALKTLLSHEEVEYGTD